ncbi:DUF3431 domain-containing protein [Aspergillus clavatus NRRL 1]|uniref:Uncharacterized protein n=1 Tax=Aspergillus clavatus (strain ATCC 1007 / CBS 513.65 / DSM 816 / NCTC 3887 / NRRL 1 / QM 1276 / 107) TaxID=344612 RepID=A1CTS4_ASPCL|nr:uncharacterized protein ACLA_084060 [Aspergillus clavatus NRRL 1]EAW06711.1 conserved hypothetical protein [Aspergillus clavatus NRRL 1]
MLKIWRSQWHFRRAAIRICAAMMFITFLTVMLYHRGDWELEAEEIIDEKQLAVFKQIGELASTFSSNSTIALVLAATQRDDLTWLLDYSRDHNAIPFVYTTDDNPTPHLLVPSTTRGREATAYLSYLVDNYATLPPYSLFIHSNKDQWHNDLFGPRTSAALRNLRLEAVDAQGYVNLRCEHNPGCPTNVHPWSPTQIDIENNDVRAFFPQVYQALFDVPAARVPEHIGNVCCGQFAVSRERILRRPRGDYERMLRWAVETELTDSFGVGWVFEKVWHIVFGEEDIYCPRFEQCRCDVYGWCGPLADGEVLQAVRRS